MVSKHRAVGLDDLDSVKQDNDTSQDQTQKHATVACEKCSELRENGAHSTVKFACVCSNENPSTTDKQCNTSGAQETEYCDKSNLNNSAIGDYSDLKTEHVKVPQSKDTTEIGSGKEIKKVTFEHSSTTDRTFNLVDMVSDTEDRGLQVGVICF